MTKTQDVTVRGGIGYFCGDVIDFDGILSVKGSTGTSVLSNLYTVSLDTKSGF